MLRLVAPFALLLLALPAHGDEVLDRARAAQARAKERGPLRVPRGDEAPECFVPKQLDGAERAKGLRLCRVEMGTGSCDGWSSEALSLVLEYEGEPAATSLGVNGDQGGLPLSQEAGPDPAFERMQCSARGWGFGRLAAPPDAGEAEMAAIEAANKSNAAAAQCAHEAEVAACLARVDRETKRQRKWKRCDLLSFDACRREAFLECRGNTGQRGLLRATWSRPKDRPANETVSVRAVPQ